MSEVGRQFALIDAGAGSRCPELLSFRAFDRLRFAGWIECIASGPRGDMYWTITDAGRRASAV